MSTLFLYNTLHGKKQPFTPIDSEHITMYVCGPTVYNYVHIGNARPVVAFDLLFRVLNTLYPKVTYARNITDVDDKINKAAAENNEPISALAERYAGAFSEDMTQLNTLTPTIEPRATHTIDEMIILIQALIKKDHAYAITEGEHTGHVLFDVRSYDNYGKLSKRSLDDMLAGARVEVASYKKYAGDFVLWKPSTGNAPGWESPWGFGRPGWHLECTAMIKKHLGDAIDIHGGGQDLIFPHHENEIAQGCCANGTNYVNYWLHNGYINIDGEKMSKSLGNFKTVRGLLELYNGEVLRFALLSAHYRSPLNWSHQLLQQAKASLDGLYTSLRNTAGIDVDTQITINDEPAFTALLDDLNSPLAISELHQLSKALNKAKTLEEKQLAKSRLIALANVLGLLYQDPEQWFKGEYSSDGLSNDAIDALILERAQAKKNRDYARADEIRDQLTNNGIVLEDSADGTRWTRQ